MAYARSLAKPADKVSVGFDEGRKGDGALLVLDSQKIRTAAFRQAVCNLETVGAEDLGPVMNNAKVPKGSNYLGYWSRSHA